MRILETALLSPSEMAKLGLQQPDRVMSVTRVVTRARSGQVVGAMKRVILSSLETIATIGVVIVLLSGVVVGFVAGARFGDGYALHGMAIGLVVAFFLAVLSFGALFLMVEINASLRNIEFLLRRVTLSNVSTEEYEPMKDHD